MSNTQVNVQTEDGSCPTYVFEPDQGSAWPALIFYMDGLAIRPTLFSMAERLASGGYLVLLPDLFYRGGPYEPLDAAEVFSDPEKFKGLRKLSQGTGNRKAAEDTAALLGYLDQHPAVKGSLVGVTGYCMGGGMALTAAATYPERIAAAATFHGGRLATDAEDSPHRLAARIKARVLVAGADNDASFPPEQAEKVRQAFQQGDVEHSVEIWSGLAHGWTMEDFPVHDQAGSERHWKELMGLFDSVLKR